MKTLPLLALLLAAPAAFAQDSAELVEVDPDRDPDDTVRLFYRGLKSGDPAVRHSAERAILVHGFDAVPPLRALAGAGPAWQKEVAARLLQSLEPRFAAACEADGLARFDLSPDGARLVLQTGPWAYELRDAQDGSLLAQTKMEDWREFLPLDAWTKDADPDLWLHEQPRFSRDGRRVYVGNVLARLLILDARTGRPGNILPEEGFVFEALPAQLEEVAELADGTTVYVGLDGTGVRNADSEFGLLDLPGGGLWTSHLGWAATETHLLRSALPDPKSPLELFAYERRAMRLLGNLAGRKIRARARETIRGAQVDWLATDAVSERVFAAGFDSTQIHMLDADPPGVLATWEVQGSPVTALAGCESRPWIATGAEDGIVRVFLSTTMERLATLDAGAPVAAVRFSLDGSALAAHAGGRVMVFRLR